MSLSVDQLIDSTLAASRVELRKFISAYAHPGESVVYSGSDWETVIPSQTQRRKNWRILMEACLYANGGTGAYNGTGWYCTTNTAAGAHYQGGGIVVIDGPLYHEPYADSEYAPFFATAQSDQFGFSTMGWTFPGGITIQGTGRQMGRNYTWAETGRTSARLIGWGSEAARWFGGAGPTPSSGAHRHLSNWSLRNIGLAATNTTAATAPDYVLHAAHYTVASVVTGLNQWWTVDDVHIDLEPTTGANAQVGFYFQCGLGCEVPKIQVAGHRNPGWAGVVAGVYNGTARGAITSTVRFGQVVFVNVKSGLLFTNASCIIDLLNFEGTAQNFSNSQLIIGDNCCLVDINRIWLEQNSTPDAGTAAGADSATIVIGGIDSDFNPGYGINTYGRPTIVNLPSIFSISHNTATTDYLIKARWGYDVQIGQINATEYAVAVLNFAPGAAITDSVKLVGSYDSSRIIHDAPALLDDDTTFSTGGQEVPSYMIDRALEQVGRSPVIPDSNTYVVGQKIINTAPASGSPVGWVATGATAAGLRPYGPSYLQATSTGRATNNLVDGAGEEYTVTVTGAALGDFVQVSIAKDLDGITQTAWVSAADTVTIRHQNESGGAIDLSTGNTFYVRVYPHP